MKRKIIKNLNEAVVLSDLHLGSSLARAKEIRAFFASIKPNTQLVLNGDTTHGKGIEFIKKHGHWDIVEIIRRHVPTTILAGNHDYDVKLLSNILKKPVYNECVLGSGGNKYFISHGHQFDGLTGTSTESKRQIIWNMIFGTGVFLTRSEKMTMKFRVLIEDAFNKFYPIKMKAIRYAKTRGYSNVILSHDHNAGVERKNTHVYANSGSWVIGRMCSFVKIIRGDLRLHIFAK